ncbi:hypothetical protein [Haloarcula salinisoli]|uniref:Uncharacterized protein n=1 Tax=Haloarcula salinisoli TaxID=2487746 RepID=A0A8J8CBI9_9EURY|nr:hypothetical protein [Halomicroarcula salinisoli]MBX0302455.1 hypothetical protein [Halomicroarcula salinisoli]
MSVLRRLLVALLLVTAMGALTVDYAASADANTAYPAQPDVEESPSAYHGERVVLWLTVTAVGDGRFTAGHWTVEATPVPASLDVGDTVAVAGTARPGHRLEANSISVIDATNRRYLYGVSVLALLASGLFVLARWRLDVQELALVPRGTETDSTGGDSQ